MQTWLLYASVGLCAGLLAGLFGIGGGIVLVPFLLWSLPLQGIHGDILMLTALGTSFGVILLTSLGSTLSHARHGHVDWHSVAALSPGMLLGTSAGAHLANGIPAKWLIVIFALFQCYVALRLVQKPRQHVAGTAPDIPGPFRHWIAGTGIGMLSALFGIGGGTLTVPYLLRHGMHIRASVGTSAACGFPIALSGCANYLWLGLQHKDLPEHMLGYLWWPAALMLALSGMAGAPLGAGLVAHLPVVQLKRYFALLIVGVAATLLLR